MIKLSDSISSYLCKNILLCDKKIEFTEEELSSVKKISISKNDIDKLKYFKNLEELDLDSFPSIGDSDIEKIASYCPNIKILKIEEQNAILKLNVKYFNKLEELCVIHNDNLYKIEGLNKIIKFIFYDNKEYEDIKVLNDLILYNKDCIYKIDIIYYVDIVRSLVELGEDLNLLSDIVWIESLGVRNFSITEYSYLEVKELYTILSDIVYKYTYLTDGVSEKFGILYQWMLNNISFINEDENSYENRDNFNNVNKVFSYMMGGRLSYAKAFQLLLDVAGVDAKIVYSMGADESIGYYDGEKVYSLLGNSDYALLRVNLEGKNYYCDIAWDSLIKEFIFADSLRMFLVSKDELKRRQKYVGEGNVVKSYSYHGDDADDLIMFSKYRVTEVDEIFEEISKNDSLLVGAELNYAFTEDKINKEKKMLGEYKENSSEYKDIEFSISSSEELLKMYKKDINKYEDSNKEIFSKYKDFFMDKYYGIEEDQNIDKRLLSYRISEYVYDVLKEYLNEK